MPKEKKILAICGSLRRGSLNRILAEALPELAPQEMAVTVAPSLAEIPLYNADVEQADGIPAPVQALAQAICAADAVVIVTPEYNFSVPGVLKNALDWVSRVQDQPFKAKPVALQSASPGLLGGARSQYHLRQVMVYLDAHVFTRPEVFVTAAKSKMDEGARKVTDEATRKAIAAQLAAFSSFIDTIRKD